MAPAPRSPIIIEVCVDSVQSASNAVRAGADRLELCANLGLGGGTTPTLGLLTAVQRVTENVPIMAMVRPRTGDFLYSDDEFQVMLEDVRIFKQHGVRGIVIGLLTREGRVDTERTKLLVDEALPLEVCFHRAFDMTHDVQGAFRDVCSIGGVSRILTSGHGRTAPTSLETLELLFQIAEELAEEEPWVLTILPGSGINPNTVGEVLDALLPLGLLEIHMSGGKWIDSAMSHRPEGMGMGVGGEGEWGVWRTQEQAVHEVRLIADAIWQVYSGTVEDSRKS